MEKRTIDVSFTNAELYVLQTWCAVVCKLHESDPLHHPPVPPLLTPKLRLDASRPQRFDQEELVALEAILAAALEEAWLYRTAAFAAGPALAAVQKVNPNSPLPLRYSIE